MTKKSWVVFLAAAACLWCGRARALAPVELTADYQRAPLAVDSEAPRLTWQLAGRRGEMQRAFRVRVRSDAGPVWDSGRREGRDQAVAPKLLLHSRTRYTWTVEVENLDGKSAQGEATFVTGLLRPADLRARWVWEDNRVEPADYAYFSKTFSLSSAPREAVALVSAHNFYVLYVNGRQVGGLINPATSDPYSAKYYLAYDLAPFLKAGGNQVAAVCQYKGAGGGNYINGVPGFLLEAKITLGDGSSVWISTGPDWKTLAETAWDEGAPWVNHRRHTQAEYYDARREPPGWPAPDEAGWRAATVVGPDYRLRAQYLPESVVDEVVTAKRRWPTWAGTWIYDFGREYGGGERLWVRGGAGRGVRVRYSDRLILGRVALDTGLNPTLYNFDRYTPGGSDGEVWEPRFGYRGFRYLEVWGWPGWPAREAVQAVSIRNDLPRTAEFSCSRPLLNRIYEISVNTLMLGQVGQLVDCVHREQSQWHADAEMQAEAIFLNFNNHQIVKKALLDLAAGQEPNGHMPANYPAEADFRYNVVEWDLHYLPMLWKTWRWSGDDALVAEVWPAAERLIEYYLGQVDATGLVPKDGGRHISDWPRYYKPVDQDGAYLTVENCLFYRTLRLGAQLAGQFGTREQAERWSAAADRLRRAINERLYDPAAGAYVDSSGSRSRRPGVSALALYCEVVPDENEARVIASITSFKKIFASIYLTYFAIDALYAHGQEAYVHRILDRSDWPGWGYMIRKGDSTTWEDWTNIASRSHPFNAYLAGTFIARMVGLQPCARGLWIEPHLEGMDWARASIRTLSGRVSASWKKDGATLLLDLEIPAGTVAGVVIPGKGIKSISEGGRAWGPPTRPCPPGISGDNLAETFSDAGGEWKAQCMLDDGRVLLSVPGGRFSFRME